MCDDGMNGRTRVTDDEQEFAFREELLQVRAVLQDGEVLVAKADGGFIEASKYFLWNSCKKIMSLFHSFLTRLKRTGFHCTYCKYTKVLYFAHENEMHNPYLFRYNFTTVL